MTPARRNARSIKFLGRQNRRFGTHSYFSTTFATIGVLTLTAVANRYLAKKAERDNPPQGKFFEIDGARLHFIERGAGEPLVLLHGNGSMIQDFESSGLIDLAAQSHRVIAFDRPGFGHSNRPRNVIWTPEAQADLITKALHKLGVSHALVLGHSWGASVAIALALRRPELVRGLILASGYYYPTVRPDVVALSAPAVPLLGDVVSHTLAPIVSRMVWPLMMAKIFGPRAVPKKFDAFPLEMAVRPSQIRASAAEAALMIPDAAIDQKRYASLKMAVGIIAGEEDRLISTEDQSLRLHYDIVQSTFKQVPGAGHMVHQTSTGEVMSAISEVSKRVQLESTENIGVALLPRSAL